MNNKAKFINKVLNDSYIKWLSEILDARRKIDTVSFPQEKSLSMLDREMIIYIDNLFMELYSYYEKKNNLKKKVQSICLNYNDNCYVLENKGNFYLCYKTSHPMIVNEDMTAYFLVDYFENLLEFPYISYNDFKEYCHMEKNYDEEISNYEFFINKVLEYPDIFLKKVGMMISQEERDVITMDINNKSCDNCDQKDKCYSSGKTNAIINLKQSICDEWINYELVGRAKVLKKF